MSEEAQSTMRKATAGATAALGLALGTGLAATPADASVVIVDHPDVLLGEFDLDADGDGTAEFSFSRNVFADADTVFGEEHTVDTFLNAVVGFEGGAFPSGTKPFAERLGPNALIDANSDFVSGASVTLNAKLFDAVVVGEFVAPGLAYVGLRFDLDDGTHFGWAEVNVGSITMQRFGYEDEVGVGLRTPGIPEPAALGLLALGASGIMALRRRQRER
jgi:PEP-CTERM motif-containing protein